MAIKKSIHINDLTKDSRIEYGTEIIFDVHKTSKKVEENINFERLKKGLIVGGIALSALLGTYLCNKPKEEPKIKTEFNLSIPQNYKAGAMHNDSVFFFGSKDSMIRDLSGKREYVDLKNLSVDATTLHRSLNILNQMNLTQIMETSNLNDVYSSYAKKNNGEIDFHFALKNLWDRKNKRPKVNNLFAREANEMIESYNIKSISDFNSYKNNIKFELENIVNDLTSNGFLKKHYDAQHNKGHIEKQRFLENYLNNINEKTIMSYFLTELFPDVNPAMNVVFFNKLLKEAGEDFINKIPALGDDLLSFGPGQLTNKVITNNGAPNLNVYLSRSNKIPVHVGDYKKTNHHVRGSILTVVYNAEILMNALFANNQLTNFNNEFEKLNPLGRELLVAGHAVSAHHASGIAARSYVDYTKNIMQQNSGFDNVHSSIKLGRLKQYHDQSLRNYLVLREMNSQNYIIK